MTGCVETVKRSVGEICEGGKRPYSPVNNGTALMQLSIARKWVAGVRLLSS